MRKKLSVSRWIMILASLMLAMPAISSAVQAPTGYNLVCDPGPSVVDNADGTSTIKNGFKLFNGQAPSRDLLPLDFTVYEDNQVVQATITPPLGSAPKQADIIINLDISGSMGGEINAVKNNIQSFVNKLTTENFDVRLGLITFGGYPQPYLVKRNNGQFYASTQDFINDISTLKAYGGTEEWFDSLVFASQYQFRPGAARILILITDERGDNKQYNINTAIPVIKNNAAKVYSISYSNIQNAVRVANETGGALYHITNNFNSILDNIAQSIANTYMVTYLSSCAPGLHTMKVEINQNNNFCEADYKCSASPVIALTSDTQTKVATGVAPDGASIAIKADITDPDGGTIDVAKITVMYPDGTSNVADMTAEGSGVYSFSANGITSAGDCIEFSIQAIDNEGRSTVRGLWQICASNKAPTVDAISPDEYDYNQDVTVTATITEPDGEAMSVVIKYKEHGALVWTEQTLTSAPYTITIPAADAGFAGIDVEVEATDPHGATGVGSKTLTVKTIPVTIIDVTRISDTLDVGPYSIYAVVVGVDTTQGDTVDLVYSVNGGTESTVPMVLTVTGTNAPLAGNSNIYFAEIPAVSQGDKVCYYVSAANQTSNAQSKKECFEVLVPVDPLKLTPPTTTVTPGEKIEFIASGGYGPSANAAYNYSWDVMDGTLSTTLGEKTTYTAVLTGKDRVSVKDAKGYVTTAIVNVLPPLMIAPNVDGRRFSPSSTVVLNGRGGEPPYSWLVDGAASFTPSDNNETVEIVLGADPAVIKVTLKDSAGRAVSVSFTNNGLLKIDPAGEVQLATDEEKGFTASGGQTPYAWSSIGGDVDDPTAASVTYKAPSLPGTYYLIVEDANGDTASVILHVGTPLRVTPNLARIMRGDSQTFEIVSGVAPYTWEATFGTLSATSGEKVTFTPEDELGYYDIKVMDAAGSLKVLWIQVSEGIVVTPSAITVEISKQKPLKATGGSGDYTWSALRGEVIPLTGAEVAYKAPPTLEEGTDEVTVRDNAGNETKVTVNVVKCLNCLNALTITPKTATVAPGDTVQFAAHNVKDVTKVKWSATKGQITPDGLYTAPASGGTFYVSVIDLSNGRKVRAEVMVKTQLVVTPTESTIPTNGTRAFTVSGGEEPYTWRVLGEGDLDNTEGTNVTFTATNKAGQSKLIVLDNQGVSAEATILVTGKMGITPLSVTMAPSMTQKFTVSGGTGTVSFAADKGNFEGAVYTAPDDIGTYIVTATDTTGEEVSATVTVGNIPIVTPRYAWLGQNGATSFTVVGGTGPYDWTATAGDVVTSGATVSYTATDVSGEVTVTVTDSLGQSSMATIYVDIPIRATREKIFVQPGETARVAVTGGIPPFEWATVSGDMETVRTEDAGYNNYTAPNVMGTDTITIRDQRNGTATVSVIVTSPIAVTPNVRYMKRGETKTFTVVSGVEPFTAVVVSGDGDLASGESADGVFTFTAGNTADDSVEIQFTDNAGQTATVYAYVETSLKVSPRTIYVDKNAKASFRVSGGTGGYDVVADSGFAEVDADTGKGTFEAPSRYGEYTMTVYDSSDQSLDVTIIVERSTPVISPSMVTMRPGESKTFMVNMGASPYEWSFTGNVWESLDANNTVVSITAPPTAGVYTLALEDAAGNTAEATINVIQALGISPASFTVFQGEKPVVRIGAVGGTPPYEWVVGSVTEKKRGERFIVVEVDTRVEVGTEYVVEVRDGNGDTAQMSIIVSRIPGDQNDDGELDEGEMLSVLQTFFLEDVLDGLKLDPELVYKHVEAYLEKSKE